MDIIIIMSWCIWMERNDLIFRNVQPSLNSTKERFKTEFAWVILRAKVALKSQMSTWIASVL
jgi:hypothetical protein